MLHLLPLLHGVHPIDSDRAPGRLQHAGDHADRGALASPIVAQQSRDRALFEGGVEPLEREQHITIILCPDNLSNQVP